MKWFKFFIGHLKSQLSNADNDKSLGELLQDSYDYYSPVLPKKSDSDTLLQSVELKGNSLTFKSILLNFTKEELDLNIEEFQEGMRAVLEAEAKRYKRLKRILLKGGVLHYEYFDKEKELLTSISLTNKNLD